MYKSSDPGVEGLGVGGRNERGRAEGTGEQ